MALTKKQLKELKEKMVTERTRILRHLDDLKGASNRDSDALMGDDADVAALEQSQAAIAQLGDREKKLLKLIDHALKKMDDDDGEYGICEYSGEDIPYKRLEISPWAKYTVEAKEEIERRERGFVKAGSGSYDYGDSDDEAED